MKFIANSDLIITMLVLTLSSIFTFKANASFEVYYSNEHVNEINSHYSVNSDTLNKIYSSIISNYEMLKSIDSMTDVERINDYKNRAREIYDSNTMNFNQKLNELNKILTEMNDLLKLNTRY